MKQKIEMKDNEIKKTKLIFEQNSNEMSKKIMDLS